MAQRNEVSDKSLLMQVNQRLMRSGAGSQGKVSATVRSGDVTLTGTLRYEHERSSFLRTASSINGVRRVIDQMQIETKKKGWT
jgi:osmotically-inducible protein OsmY